MTQTGGDQTERVFENVRGVRDTLSVDASSVTRTRWTAAWSSPLRK